MDLETDMETVIQTGTVISPPPSVKIFSLLNIKRCDEVTGGDSPGQRAGEEEAEDSRRQSEEADGPPEPDSPDSPPASMEEEAILDHRRSRRSTKRDGHCCPVCGVTLRDSELRGHFERELDRLAKVRRNSKKPKRDESGINMTFVQVRCNRENRLTAKVSKYAAKAKKEVQCPVCNLRMSGCEEDINKHVALCVQNEEDSDIVVDDDADDEPFEEYEIGDEVRIRAISLVPGGHRVLQGLAPRNRRREDEDLDVVDIDDTLAFGQPQYTELDVITNTSGDDESQEQLRKAVLLDPTAQPLVLESRKWSSCNNDVEEKEDSKGCTSDHIVTSLKEKIKDLEDQNKSVKCLICMEAYTKPVVSTTCWHVYCEECWLMTMGVKKLCPQCNMIVFPSDLRRIYL